MKWSHICTHYVLIYLKEEGSCWQRLPDVLVMLGPVVVLVGIGFTIKRRVFSSVGVGFGIKKGEYWPNMPEIP